jgi:hypothetical protein
MTSAGVNATGFCWLGKTRELHAGLAKMEAKDYHCTTMATLVIKSFPEALHTKLRQIAMAHRRSVTQETIHLLETAIALEQKPTTGSSVGSSYWANRQLLSEYEALLKSGQLKSDDDCTIGISEERDAR